MITCHTRNWGVVGGVWEEEMGARMREDNGRGRGLGVGDDRFFTPLRYVQNDMWGALR